VSRRLADAPVVAEVAPDDRWDLPIRLLGALHYLALSKGLDPWKQPEDAIAADAEFVARFLSEQRVQTNEVQRSWALLPAFLSLGDGPLELLELGPSAGLNLIWDRYRYRYEAGTWGAADSPLELAGDERRGVPAALLERRPEVLRRRGIDLEPVDVTTAEGARLLECFVWADQMERIERLRRAVEAVRADPPELIQGDYVELLPRVLAKRDPEALTVVFQTASLGYLTDERRDRLYNEIEAGGRKAPLAFLTAAFDESLEGCWPLELTVWPRGEARRLAHQDFHGAWIEWLVS
jgi:hypothetical protein